MLRYSMQEKFVSILLRNDQPHSRAIEQCADTAYQKHAAGNLAVVKKPVLRTPISHGNSLPRHAAARLSAPVELGAARVCRLGAGSVLQPGTHQ